MQSFSLTGADSARIVAYRSMPKGEPKAIVQIAHGLGEHFKRYARLAAALNAAGYAVYGNDHRGHGQTAGADALGQFGEGGFQAVVDDMAALTAVAKREVPGKPFVLLGHSMGSFAAQRYLLEHSDELAALVLSGTAAADLLVAHIMASGGPGGLGAFNGAFEPARTGFDWLSRDAAEVDAYIADPLCGFDLDAASAQSLFMLAGGARADPRIHDVRKSLPVYVISGEFDPVVGPGQSFANALIDSYRAAGLTDITHRVYPGGRHEMFNETNRAEVEADLVAWLNGTVAK